MDTIKLVEPDFSYKNQVLSYIEDHHKIGDNNLYGGGGLNKMSTYEEWLKSIKDKALGINVPSDKVPSSTFLAVDSSNKMIGIVTIRHMLNEALLNDGGHIGYGVRPSERGKGYATEILRLSLIKAKELGIDKVLVTCDVTNLASAKVIEKNGGLFEDIRVSKHDWSQSKRYWIEIQ